MLDDDPSIPLVPYRALILLSTGDELLGQVIRVYSDEGRTDGLLHVRIGQRTVNVYERHIVTLEKVA